MLTPLQTIARHGLELGGPAASALPRAPGDWRRLVQEVRRHRLIGLLASAVADGAITVSAEERAEVASLEVGAAATAVRLEQSLLDAVEILSTHGIDYRVLKGPAVAHLDYDDPMLRHFGDIDLLVLADSLDATAAALVAAGGVRTVPELAPGFDRRFGKGFTIATRRGPELDVHRTFVAGRFGLRLDPADLFSTAATFELGGRAIPALAHEERFLHAAFHVALGDVMPRLTAVRDVVQIGSNPAVDWLRVRVLIARWRCEAVIERALAHATERLAVDEFAEELREVLQLDPSERDRRAVHAYLATDGRFARQALGAITEVPGWWPKVAYLRALAAPDRSNLQTRNRSRFAHLVRGARHALAQTLDR